MATCGDVDLVHARHSIVILDYDITSRVHYVYSQIYSISEVKIWSYFSHRR